MNYDKYKDFIEYKASVSLTPVFLIDYEIEKRWFAASQLIRELNGRWHSFLIINDKNTDLIKTIEHNNSYHLENISDCFVDWGDDIKVSKTDFHLSSKRMRKKSILHIQDNWQKRVSYTTKRGVSNKLCRPSTRDIHIIDTNCIYFPNWKIKMSSGHDFSFNQFGNEMINVKWQNEQLRNYYCPNCNKYSNKSLGKCINCQKSICDICKIQDNISWMSIIIPDKFCSVKCKDSFFDRYKNMKTTEKISMVFS
ncbi:hypothetical protein ACFLZ1_01200 [Patescibacteria group bacterium]